MLNNDTSGLITAHNAVSYGVWRSRGHGKKGDNGTRCRPGSCGVNYEGHIGPTVLSLPVTHAQMSFVVGLLRVWTSIFSTPPDSSTNTNTHRSVKRPGSLTPYTAAANGCSLAGLAQTNVRTQTHKRGSGGVCPDSCLTFITASSPVSRHDWQSRRRAAKCTVCEPWKGL